MVVATGGRGLLQCSNSSGIAARTLRPTWLPGLDARPYLDGSLVGDYGFDPLGLGEDPESLKWYVQAELVNARFAMTGIAGILFTDLSNTKSLDHIYLIYSDSSSSIFIKLMVHCLLQLLRVTGISNLPVWSITFDIEQLLEFSCTVLPATLSNGNHI
ncbi:hypothetical protein GIB67_010754 [Kingdonia uniflora]|uniref:Chlorophyll a-b binding protein, chloroplastic n=1 Tax=Kingdonia uniflora TaxID=39325 RepID=A0A7J7L907_9MAGN|nr:hypothetical protein GIB67_010754 [Kingdonia uniflora]